MDGFTHVFLGAAIGTVTIGRKVGARKGALIGGLMAELPDIDFIFPVDTPVDVFTEHRGPTHSLLMDALAAPLFGEALRYADRRLKDLRWFCYGFMFLVLASHGLLDGFTAYGTRLLWPLFNTPISWSNIFIIDPLFTLPLLIAFVVSMAARPPGGGEPLSGRTRRVASAALVLSASYLVFTLMALDLARGRVMDSLAAGGARYERVTVMPMPFNPLLWRGLAIDGGRYYNTYISLLDDGPAPLHEHPRDTQLIAELEGNAALAKIAWFSRGFYTAREAGGVIYATDLRVGIEPNYVLNFSVARRNSEQIVATPPVRDSGVRNISQLGWVWRRTFDATLTRDE